VERLEASIAEEEGNLASYNEEKEAISESIEHVTAQSEKCQTELDKCNSASETHRSAVEAARQDLAKVSKEAENRAKVIASKEAQIDKINAEKWGVFRRCKLEEIHLPLVEGSLEDISLEAVDVSSLTSELDIVRVV
jgi:structural maintenance of chromosome 1